MQLGLIFIALNFAIWLLQAILELLALLSVYFWLRSFSSENFIMTWCKNVNQLTVIDILKNTRGNLILAFPWVPRNRVKSVQSDGCPSIEAAWEWFDGSLLSSDKRFVELNRLIVMLVLKEVLFDLRTILWNTLRPLIWLLVGRLLVIVLIFEYFLAPVSERACYGVSLKRDALVSQGSVGMHRLEARWWHFLLSNLSTDSIKRLVIIWNSVLPSI